MNKSKKIILFTIGNIDHPSSRIRGIQYIPYLEKAGYKVKWIPRIPPKPKNKLEKYFIFPVLKRWLSTLRLFHILFSSPDYFFIQKIFIPIWLLRILKKRNISYIYDFDDAIYLDSKNKKAQQHTIQSIMLANHVIVSNSILAKFCENHGIIATIINTPVDINRITPREKPPINDALIIGWIGSFWTTKYLELVKKPLQEIAKSNKVILRLVGADTRFTIPGVAIEHLNWQFEKEEEHLQSFNIGIMPLTAGSYSEAKGGYKLLMYMAAGIPSIASPIGINKEIIQEGNTGFLADNEEDWITSIQFFLDHPKKITIFGVESRKLAKKMYSREVRFEQLLTILK